MYLKFYLQLIVEQNWQRSLINPASELSAIEFSSNNLLGFKSCWVDTTPVSWPVYLYKTTDGGLSWPYCYLLSNASFAEIVTNIRWIEGTTNLYYSTETFSGNRIFKSTDNGEHWNPMVLNLIQDQVVCMSLVKKNNKVWGYATTANRLIFQLAGESVGINKIESTIPLEYMLYQNYPNPFNPATKIKFEIPSSENGKWKMKNGLVTLVVYDALGKEVATLVNEKLQPGEYETSFDGSKLSSGIYFYKLSAGDYQETKRMVLIK